MLSREHNECRGGAPRDATSVAAENGGGFRRTSTTSAAGGRRTSTTSAAAGGAGATSTGAHLRMNGRVGELDWEGRNKRPLRNKRGAQQVRGGREHVEGTAQQVRWNSVGHDCVSPRATSVHCGGAVGLPRGFCGGRAQLWVPTRLCLLRHRVTVHKQGCVATSYVSLPPSQWGHASSIHACYAERTDELERALLAHSVAGRAMMSPQVSTQLHSPRQWGACFCVNSVFYAV